LEYFERVPQSAADREPPPVLRDAATVGGDVEEAVVASERVRGCPDDPSSQLITRPAKVDIHGAGANPRAPRQGGAHEIDRLLDVRAMDE
jgi:hypothetical protein